MISADRIIEAVDREVTGNHASNLEKFRLTLREKELIKMAVAECNKIHEEQLKGYKQWVETHPLLRKDEKEYLLRKVFGEGKP